MRMMAVASGPFVGRKSRAGLAARAIPRTPVVVGLRRRFGFRDSSTYWEKRCSHGLLLLPLERWDRNAGRYSSFREKLRNWFK